MGYVSSTKSWGTPQLQWNALHLDNSALVLNDGNKKGLSMSLILSIHSVMYGR